MDNKNTLQITAQYPAERYNLLVPMQTVAEIAEIHKPVMNAVQISTNEADKEIYLQDRSKAKADGWALTKKGLNKLMRAAGIKILGTRPIIPSTCQKCAEVNKSIGRPVNCGTCGNKDVKFEAKARDRRSEDWQKSGDLSRKRPYYRMMSKSVLTTRPTTDCSCTAVRTMRKPQLSERH